MLIFFLVFQALNKQAITFLKTLVGNDKVKAEAMKTGSPQLIIAALAKHQVNVIQRMKLMYIKRKMFYIWRYFI